MEQTVSRYLKYLNLPISEKYCKKLILSHPDYPSLLSITDTLERLNINYQVARIQRESISGIQFPYLLQPEDKKGWISLIKDQRDLTRVNRTNIEYSHCIVLQVDSTDIISNEKNNLYLSQEFSDKVTFSILISAIAILLIFSLIQLASWILTIFLLTSVCGAAIGFMLVSKDLGSSYSFVESLCRGKRKQANTTCDAILKSDVAVLLGNITLSDLVASYFTFQLVELSLVLPTSTEITPWLEVLSVLSAFSIPVVGYSVFFQQAKVKVWCRLCLAVDTVLIIQSALFVYMYINDLIRLNDGNLFETVTSILLCVAVGASILLIRTKLKELNKITKSEIEANRIKYTPSVFMELLSKKKKVDSVPFSQEILIGDANAPVKILMAASLTCTPCKIGFEKAIQVVSIYPKKVSLAVRFSQNSIVNSDHITESRYILFYWFKNIYGKQNESIHTKDLLLSWFSRMSLKSFVEQHPLRVGGNYMEIQILEDERREWFEQTKITGTPTFFINGYQLPEEYQIEDLMGLVPGLVDQFQKVGSV